MELKIEYIPVEDLKPYERNNKKHADFDVGEIAKSIEKYGFNDPIGVYGKNIIVEGHGRLLAAKKLGMETVPCIRLDHMTDKERREYAILHNKTAELAEYDFANIELELPDLDFSEFNIDFGFPSDDEETELQDDEQETLSLAERFIAPPFSILDTRQGYWQDRKRQWKALGIQSELGRDVTTIHTKEFIEKLGHNPQSGTSIFDPVLCELMYKWFCTPNGKIFDCFAGGSVRGIVADKLGYDYYGIDLRQEQIDANIKNAKEVGVNPHWYCDDSLNADKYIQDNSCDMIFSCPPYADLEVYSDDERDISNMEYDDFCRVYAEIISIACRKLKQDRFAVFVVGDIRDKQGFYRNFIDYTKKCFNDNGLLTYNEAILLDSLSTAPIRAGKQFQSSRKLCKVHQNVLIFYKGNPKNIKSNYPEVEVDDSIFEDTER